MRVILILFFIICFSLSALADSSQASLDKARNLVDQRHYPAAIKEYERISQWLWRDPGLVIERARVYTYANLHKEAIDLFEQVLAKYPERLKEIAPELAQQYQWNDQLDKAAGAYRQAINFVPADTGLRLQLAQVLVWQGQQAEALAEYDSILADDPANITALLLKGETISWQDNFQDALPLYAKVLAQEPRNIQARNAIARINVWRGRHRKGIRLYKETLSFAAADPDALLGLAYAYHWEDQDRRALEELETLLDSGTHNAAAWQLYDKIKLARSAYVEVNSRYSSSKYDLAIFDSATRFGFYPEASWRLEGLYSWQRLRQPGKFVVEAQRRGVGISKVWNDYLNFDTYLYATTFNFQDYTAFTSATWFTFKPHDMWRFYLAYDRETFEDIDALLNRVIVNSGSFSGDFKPNRDWFFSFKYKRGSYSDGNNQDSLMLKSEYFLNQSPAVKLYHNYYFSDWSEEKNNGYFNPVSVQSHLLGIFGNFEVSKKISLEAKISGGYERQNPSSDHIIVYTQAGVTYRLSDAWSVALSGDYFDSRPNETSKGYSQKTAFLTFTYNFSGSREKPSVLPSRPISGR